MKIKVSKCIGFCFGVKRAIDLAHGALKKYKTVYSLGPIIHNPQVVKELSFGGLKIVRDLKKIKKGALVIPSHGIEPAAIRDAKQKKLRLINTTCPFVTKSQELVTNLNKAGYKVLIVGDSSHPEVKALLNYARGNVEVVSNKNEAAKLDLKNKKASIIAQTTLLQKSYIEIVKLLLNKKFKELRVFNTICNETVRRQDDTRRLAKEVGLMLVIGGKNSANTSRLVKICRELQRDVYHIEDSSELKKRWFKKKHSVGISSGASTPDWIVKKVVTRLKKI